MAFSRVELCKGSFQSSELCVHVASCMHYDKVLRNYVEFHVCSLGTRRHPKRFRVSIFKAQPGIWPKFEYEPIFLVH